MSSRAPHESVPVFVGMGMTLAYISVTLLTVAINLAAAIVDFVRLPCVLRNGAAINVPESWLPTLGSLKVAGAIGLMLGLAGIPVIGVAGAIGLVLFFVGAVIAHLRVGEHRTMVYPSIFLGTSIATLVLMAITETGH